MLIREQDRKALAEIFSKTNSPIEVWAYGSRVNGSAHDTSDLDLVLRTADLTPLAFDEFETMVDEIQNSNIPILVEIRDWAYLPESFRKEIIKNYEILYSSIPTTAVMEK